MNNITRASSMITRLNKAAVFRSMSDHSAAYSMVAYKHLNSRSGSRLSNFTQRDFSSNQDAKDSQDSELRKDLKPIKQSKDNGSGSKSTNDSTLKKYSTLIWSSIGLIASGTLYKLIDKLWERRFKDAVDQLDNKIGITLGINQLVDSSEDIYHIDPDYYIIEDNFHKAREILAQYRVLAVHGEPGSGKTMFADRFAQMYYNKTGQYHKIKADDKQYMEAHYKTRYGINSKQLDSSQLRHDLARALKNNHGDILFVFDNVDSFTDVEKYIVGLPDNAKVIVTTRGKPEQYKCLKLGEFTNQQTREFIDSQMKIDPHKVDQIIEAAGTLPQRLRISMSYLNKEILSIDDFIGQHAALREKGDIDDPFYDLVLGVLAKKSENAWRMLQCLSCLDADFIPRTLFNEIFPANELSTSLNLLESMSLLEKRYFEGNLPGYTIHRTVQQYCREQMARNRESSLSRETIYKDLMEKTSDKKLKEPVEMRMMFPHMKKVAKWVKNASPEQDNLVAIFSEKYGDINEKLGNFEEALEWYERSHQMQKILHQNNNHPDVARSLNNIGSAHKSLGHYKQALYHHEQSYQMRRILYNDSNHPDVAASLTNLGTVFESLGQYQQALKFFEQSHQIQKALHNDNNHPDVATSLNNLGYVHSSLGHHEQALQYHEQSYQMRKVLYHNSNHPEIARSIKNLGYVHKSLGQYEQALKYYEQSHQIQKALHQDSNHPEVARSLNNLGSAHESLGHYDQALLYYDQSYQMRKTLHHDNNHPDVARSLHNLGSIQEALNHHEQALGYYDNSYQMRKALHHDSAHPEVARSLKKLAHIHKVLGHKEEAQRYQDLYQNMTTSLSSDASDHRQQDVSKTA